MFLSVFWMPLHSGKAPVVYAAKVPKFEGDRSNFVKALKAKYDDDIWSERITLLESTL